MAKARKTIKTEFKGLCCPHCEQHGIDALFKVVLAKGKVAGFKCKLCKSFWGADGSLTLAPKQSALRKLLK